MKKVLILFLFLGDVVMAKWEPKPTFEKGKIILRGGITKCGVVTIESKSNEPVTLVGLKTRPDRARTAEQARGGITTLNKRGDSVRFKYDGFGRKKNVWIYCSVKRERTLPGLLAASRRRSGRQGRVGDDYKKIPCEEAVLIKDSQPNISCKKAAASYKPFFFARELRWTFREKTIK